MSRRHDRIEDAITRAMGDRINHASEKLVIAHLDRIATALERIADNGEKVEIIHDPQGS